MVCGAGKIVESFRNLIFSIRKAGGFDGTDQAIRTKPGHVVGEARIKIIFLRVKAEIGARHGNGA